MHLKRYQIFLIFFIVLSFSLLPFADTEKEKTASRLQEERLAKVAKLEKLLHTKDIETSITKTW